MLSIYRQARFDTLTSTYKPKGCCREPAAAAPSTGGIGAVVPPRLAALKGEEEATACVKGRKSMKGVRCFCFSAHTYTSKERAEKGWKNEGRLFLSVSCARCVDTADKRKRRRTPPLSLHSTESQPTCCFATSAILNARCKHAMTCLGSRLGGWPELLGVPVDSSCVCLCMCLHVCARA